MVRARWVRGIHLMVASTNWASMQNIVGARRAMCCTKVNYEFKSVVWPPTKCNSLPCNELGCATMLDVPLSCGIGMGGVLSIDCWFGVGNIGGETSSCNERICEVGGWTSPTYIWLSSSSTLSYKLDSVMMKFDWYIGYCILYIGISAYYRCRHSRTNIHIWDKFMIRDVGPHGDTYDNHFFSRVLSMGIRILGVHKVEKIYWA